MKKTVKIGLVGYGTVGRGVVKILERNKRLIEDRVGTSVEVAGICDLLQVPVKSNIYTRDYRDLLKRPDIDIVVELIGGYEPARTMILGALKAGKNVVTANKAVLAKYWSELFISARANEKLLYFEASVGGAIPVIQGLNEGLAANKIEQISGILNGTTNFILSEMTKNKVEFKKALKKAQLSGFAEADPSFDLQGIDTANKIAVLSSLAWSGHVKLKDIDVMGIENISRDDICFAEKFGYTIKLIGSARMHRDVLELSVQPCLVSRTHAFANVENEYNAVLIHGDAVDDIIFYGKGAGQFPAASAVVSDIISLARQVVSGTAGKEPYVNYDPKKKIKILPREKVEGSFYLRFTAFDKPGVLAKISGILGKNGVSIATVYQEEPLAVSKKGVPVVILTHSGSQGNILKALKKIDALPEIKSPTVKYKIEK